MSNEIKKTPRNPDCIGYRTCLSRAAHANIGMDCRDCPDYEVLQGGVDPWQNHENTTMYMTYDGMFMSECA